MDPFSLGVKLPTDGVELLITTTTLPVSLKDSVMSLKPPLDPIISHSSPPTIKYSPLDTEKMEDWETDPKLMQMFQSGLIFKEKSDN